MSIAHDIPLEAGLGHLPGPPVQNSGSQPQPLHRISDARRRQGISVRSAARRMQTSMEHVRRQEDPGCDMLLSDLYRWQNALEVPVAELLVDIGGAAIGARFDAGPVVARDENRAGHQRVGQSSVNPTIRNHAGTATRRTHA